jgi:5-methylcytosine-specific restriction endonuclease McrA
MKTCTRCKIEKPKTEFNKCATRNGGFQYKCRSCEREYEKENAKRISERKREYRKANSEKISARMREYHKANAERIAGTHRKYREENREKIAEQSRKYVKANLEKVIEYKRGYAKDNPEKLTAYSRNRRARERSAEGAHTAADVRAIFDKQQGLCANCETKLFKSGMQKFHVDHIMPLALGGSNWPCNLQCLCPACNLSKGAKHPDDWAKQQGRLI